MATAARQEDALTSTFTYWSKHPAIDYATQPSADPIAELSRKIQAGQVTFTSDGQSGVLRSLLTALNVPLSSQIVVFAKDSLQAGRITPQNPRAIYFNDSIAVAWCAAGLSKSRPRISDKR